MALSFSSIEPELEFVFVGPVGFEEACIANLGGTEPLVVVKLQV